MQDKRMGPVTGLERVTYGVEDMALGKRFFRDWGLKLVSDGPDRVVFATLEGSEVELRPIDAPDLPPAIEPGSTVREVTWGVKGPADLERLHADLRSAGDVQAAEDGSLRCFDPSGLALRFQVSRRRVADVKGCPTNSYGHHPRKNQPSRIYDSAEPVRLSHIVINTADLARHQAFYMEVLGFHLSDSYPGDGVFLRCQAEGGHHDLFLLRHAQGKVGLNHVSFMVRDIYEVFGGGINVTRLGWETHIGPGRHPISSAIFWYVKCPCGGLVEYYADEDYLTADWVPRELPRTAASFAEWSIVGGIDSETRKQKR